MFIILLKTIDKYMLDFETNFSIYNILRNFLFHMTDVMHQIKMYNSIVQS